MEQRMEQLTVSKILGPGWTYCPRCDDNVMVPDKATWHCPFCGVTLTVGKLPPLPPEMMVWSEPLTDEEINREAMHLQAKATAWVEAHKDKPIPRLPRRLVWFNRVVKPLAWLLSCKVVVLLDKKYKEVTGEQGK